MLAHGGGEGKRRISRIMIARACTPPRFRHILMAMSDLPPAAAPDVLSEVLRAAAERIGVHGRPVRGTVRRDQPGTVGRDRADGASGRLSKCST